MGEATGVIGIGYEGQDLDEFVLGLQKWEVRTLVDVRLNAISRKRGFSKTALRAGLAAAGIDYLHEPTLGNPKENREGFAESGTSKGKQARDHFIGLLSMDVPKATLDSIAQLASDSRVAVMCFERSELHCHRQQVLSEIRERLSTLADV